MHSFDDTSDRAVADLAAPVPGTSPSLIYEPFYGLREKPFSLSADPRFWFRSPAHGRAFDELLTGIRRREGLIVLTGEIGTGKTTLCRSVVERLDRRTFAAFVPDPFVSREDLLKTLLVDFGVVSMSDLASGRFTGASRSDLSYLLYNFLDSLVPLQAFAVVVIDEAQHLSLPLLEEIRVLSELERREKLLQVVLVGQPELRASLKLPQMRQVDHRVSVRSELKALDADGVAQYVRHRLQVAGRGAGRVVFTSAALEAVYHGSAGVPRLVNRICDRALYRAYPSQTLQIDTHFVRDAIDDLGLEVMVESTHVEAPKVVVDPPVLPRPASGALLLFDDETPNEGSLSGLETIDEAGRGRRWMPPAIAAAALALAATAGAFAWYAGGQTIDAAALAALRPARPLQRMAPGLAIPRPAPGVLETGAPAAAAPAATPAPADDSAFSILVASFRSQERANRVVEELTSAGYRARAIERDWGPPRGRLVHVSVPGYASALEVERDLRRIRELPGGYRDARIVARE
jgi:type II secretory pathway predicted ATPase ExeA/cell division septation protein DedD